MGKSMDFSEGIKLIRAAHGDAAAILAKWRELLEAPGEVTLSMKNADGTVDTIQMPSIRECINRYLGGVFEQVTLTDNGVPKIIIRLNDSGEVELVDTSDAPVNLIAKYLATSKIISPSGTLPISGEVQMSKGSIENGTIQALDVSGGRIGGATFGGTAKFSGATQINGTLSVKRVATESLYIGSARIGKQVVDWAVEGIVSSALNGPTSGGLWTGDPAVLEAAGIFPEPTWSDCTYVPDILAVTSNYLNVYWGEPGASGAMVQVNQGSYTFTPAYVAMWPYKMYEAVQGGYRIRWLPLNEQAGNIHYARSGTASYLTATTIVETVTPTLTDVQLRTSRMVHPYSCDRFMARCDEEAAGTTLVRNHRLIKA